MSNTTRASVRLSMCATTTTTTNPRSVTEKTHLRRTDRQSQSLRQLWRPKSGLSRRTVISTLDTGSARREGRHVTRLSAAPLCWQGLNRCCRAGFLSSCARADPVKADTGASGRGDGNISWGPGRWLGWPL